MQPEKLGPFRICRLLGRGGMGAVYEGVHEQTNESVAIKVLIDTFDETNDTRLRFEAEIDTLKRLRHPNIVRLFGFGKDQGTLYYVMELVEGASLHAELKRKRYFYWHEVAKIGMEMCQALRHAHDRGITHRDVKPANILLEKNGIVKLSDFGIASLFGSQRLTDVNAVVGTLEYMSPEQALAYPVGPRSDMYSLGAVLYALILNKPPFTAKHLVEVIKKHQENMIEPIRLSRVDVPEEMETIILNLLQIQPNSRPQSPFAVARRFQAILQNQFGQIEKITIRPTLDNSNSQNQLPNAAVDVKIVSFNGKIAENNSNNSTADSPNDHTNDINATKSLTNIEPSKQNNNINSTQFEFERQHNINDKANENDFNRNKNGIDDAARESRSGIEKLPMNFSAGSDKIQATAKYDTQHSVFTKVNEHELGELSGLPAASSSLISLQTIFASLSLLLIGGVVLYILQPVPPDVLYERILAKLHNADDEDVSVESLRRAEVEIRYFLNHYADHVRVGQVRMYEDQLNLANLERRLEWRRQISDPAAISPVERAYLEATSWIKSDPTKAIIKLQAVIDLFGNEIVPPQPEERTDKENNTDQAEQTNQKNSYRLQSPTEMCVELARRRLREIEKRIETITADQEAFLEKRIQDAKNLIDSEPEQAKKLLTGIIELYSDQNWTIKHVNESRNLLNKIKTKNETPKNNRE
ncbi:MAG: serine/threonine protein kinase [Planctomycetaceae bacterium]|jgi:serine/threonine-protein kinase|nr:serine/threonine protein kinase [Planctomycetaceae bacterium]